MRINIEIPGRQSLDYNDRSFASSSRVNLSQVPVPLVELVKSSRGNGIDGQAHDSVSGNDLALIELQGTLEIDDVDPVGGQVLGKLEFHKGREDKPTLLVSHHRLEGKIVSLTKPLVVLERKQRVMAAVEDASKGTPTRSGSPPRKRHRDLPSSPLHFQAGREAAILDEPDAADFGGPASPSLGRATSSGAERQALLCSSPPQAGVRASSSPMPPPRAMRGSEIDYSSPVPASKRQRFENSKDSDLDRRPVITTEGSDVEQDDDEWLYKRETATSFEVVCIVRKKILFSKRPEPVVRLDTEGGQAARAAIGKSLAV